DDLERSGWEIRSPIAVGPGCLNSQTCFYQEIAISLGQTVWVEAAYSSQPDSVSVGQDVKGGGCCQPTAGWFCQHFDHFLFDPMVEYSASVTLVSMCDNPSLQILILISPCF
ncbi:MAG: hypothetical protein KAG70_14090, partial [Alcanivorax sp.]|nr:hypothetical protein [Alcanivorax sp.]